MEMKKKTENKNISRILRVLYRQVGLQSKYKTLNYIKLNCKLKEIRNKKTQKTSQIGSLLSR